MDIKKPAKRLQSAASPRKRPASATKPAAKSTSKKSPQSLKSDIDKAIEAIDKESPALLGAPASRKPTKSGRKPWSKRHPGTHIHLCNR